MTYTAIYEKARRRGGRMFPTFHLLSVWATRGRKWKGSLKRLSNFTWMGCVNWGRHTVAIEFRRSS
jgi:hypothetical protein